MKFFFVLSVALVLASCATTEGLVDSLQPVCKAIGEPFVYNPNNKNSPYHAGSILVRRLAKQNRVGINLACPAYK